MKTTYVSMGVETQKKLVLLLQLFKLGSDQIIDPYNIIVMSYTPPDDSDKQYPELILNIKWSLGIEFGLLSKEKNPCDGYTIQQSVKNGTKWVPGISFHDGIHNLWKAVTTKTIVIKQWRYQTGEYHLYEWNQKTKKFEYIIK